MSGKVSVKRKALIFSFLTALCPHSLFALTEMELIKLIDQKQYAKVLSQFPTGNEANLIFKAYAQLGLAAFEPLELYQRIRAPQVFTDNTLERYFKGCPNIQLPKKLETLGKCLVLRFFNQIPRHDNANLLGARETLRHLQAINSLGKQDKVLFSITELAIVLSKLRETLLYYSHMDAHKITDEDIGVIFSAMKSAAEDVEKFIGHYKDVEAILNQQLFGSKTPVFMHVDADGKVEFLEKKGLPMFFKITDLSRASTTELAGRNMIIQLLDRAESYFLSDSPDNYTFPLKESPRAYDKKLSFRGKLERAQRLELWESSIKAVNASKVQMHLSTEEFPTRSDVEVYKLTFSTLNHKDELVQTTGLVLFPSQVNEALPFVSYQHATRLKPEEAPTALPVDPELRANAILYASDCCIVTMADYLGLDKLNDSPQFYMNAEIQARVAYDLMSAAKEFLYAKGRSYRNEVLIAGYSQGAHNAMGLHKYIQFKKPEMKVLATSTMSGPYSVSAMARQVLDDEIKLKINPVFLGLALFGMHEAYDDFPRFSELLQPEYAKALPTLLRKGKFSEIRNSLPKNIDELFQVAKVLEIVDESDETPFWQALIKNDVDNFVPNAPVLMTHSKTDEVIPYSTAIASLEKLEAAGAEVGFFEIEKAQCDHVEAAFPSFLKTAEFFKVILSE
ncbi:MAG: lipase family protein [Bdellovibrionota bacterium]